MSKNTYYVIGGSTVSYINSGIALVAPDFGDLARSISTSLQEHLATLENAEQHNIKLILTRMADHNSSIITDEHLDHELSKIADDPTTRHVIFATLFPRFAATSPGRLNGPRAAPFPLEVTDNPKIEIHPTEQPYSFLKQDRPDIITTGCMTVANFQRNDEGTIARTQRLRESYYLDMLLLRESSIRETLLVSRQGIYSKCTTDKIVGNILYTHNHEIRNS